MGNSRHIHSLIHGKSTNTWRLLRPLLLGLACASAIAISWTPMGCGAARLSRGSLDFRRAFATRTRPRGAWGGQMASLAASRNSSGACSGPTIFIPVSAEADIYRRLQYPPEAIVALTFQASVVLSQGLVLNASFSCTRLLALGPTPASLAYPNSDAPTVTIINSSNVWLSGLDIRHGANASSDPCTFALFQAGRNSDTLLCPGVYIVSSFGVLLTHSSILGRTDIFRSTHVLLDHIRATVAAGTYDAGHAYRDYRTRGVINIGQTSPSATGGVPRSLVVISNSEVFGAWELISLSQGAAGVTVANNFLHGFLFTAVRCGAEEHPIMDCHHNIIARNVIYNPPNGAKSRDTLNSGVYFHTKWFNPGNVAECNFILNQKLCYFLARDSSGVTIQGGLCQDSWTTLRIDTGKYNKIQGLISDGASMYLSLISCATLLSTNCFTGVGNNWEAMRRAYYDTSVLNKKYPYMKAICDPVRASISNVLCNPPSQTSATVSQTGYCSAFPYGNKVELFTTGPPTDNSVDPFRQLLGCDMATIDLTLLNNQTWLSTTRSRAGGRSHAQSSVVSSCTWDDVGPFPASPGFYYSFFNLTRPALFDYIVSFDVGHIENATRQLPASDITVIS